MIADLKDTKAEPVSTPKSAMSTTVDRPANLDELARRIAMDARKDTLRYLVRSNTSHDGE